MKKLIVFIALILPASLLAQSRSGMIVPYNWVNEDSMRVGIFGANEGWIGLQDSLDCFGANFDYEWGAANPEWVPKGNRKGWMAYGLWSGAPISLTDLGEVLRPITFYPTLSKLHDVTLDCNFWRYLDTSGYTYHDNRYDENDISAYAEWTRDEAMVTSTFPSMRYTTFMGGDTNAHDLAFGDG